MSEEKERESDGAPSYTAEVPRSCHSRRHKGYRSGLRLCLLSPEASQGASSNRFVQQKDQGAETLPKWADWPGRSSWPLQRMKEMYTRSCRRSAIPHQRTMRLPCAESRVQHQQPASFGAGSIDSGGRHQTVVLKRIEHAVIANESITVSNCRT